MLLLTFTLGPFGTNSYLVFCPETHEGIVIDPGFDAQIIVESLQREKLKVAAIVNTHGHIDHTNGNSLVRDITGARLLIHRQDADELSCPNDFLLSLGLTNYTPAEPDGFLAEGDEVKFGNESLRVIHTPGHTPGGVCLLGKGTLFTGDTLFAGSVGRCDLPGGDEEELLRSIRDKILNLPDETVLLPGHGPSTTIGKERLENPFL